MTTDKIVNRENSLPTSFEEIRALATAFKESGMFADTKSLAQAIVKIQAGRELGLPPVYSMQNINMIRDRLTTSANTMAMLVKKSGKYNYRIITHTDTECKIKFFEDNKEAGDSVFTIDDAKRANLVKPESGWMKFPRAMLFSRAISQGARIYCPDAIAGVYTDEEIRSIPERPEVEGTANSEATEVKALPVTPQSPSETPPAESNAEHQEPTDKVLPNGLNLTSVKEQLTEAQWTPADVGKYLVSHFKVSGKRASEMLAQLNADQVKEFLKTIDDRRSAAGK